MARARRRRRGAAPARGLPLPRRADRRGHPRGGVLLRSAVRAPRAADQRGGARNTRRRRAAPLARVLPPAGRGVAVAAAHGPYPPVVGLTASRGPADTP